MKLENLKNWLFDILKYLFVPEENYFEEKFKELKSSVGNKIPLDYIDTVFNQLKNTNGKFLDDIYFKDVKIVDMTSINQAIPRLKVYTDGFFWFLLMLYNYNQIYFLIRGTYPIKIGKGE